MKTTRIITLFVYRKGRVLLLLRSRAVRTLRSHWAGLSGRIEEGETPRDAALREMEEEVGLFRGEVQVRIEGDAIEIPDHSSDILWVVHPILGTPSGPAGHDLHLRLDWEHVGYTWVFPEDMTKYRTVPGLPETLGRLLGGLDLRRLAPWRNRIQEIAEGSSNDVSRAAALLLEMSRSGSGKPELLGVLRLLAWSRPELPEFGRALLEAWGDGDGWRARIEELAGS